MVVSYEVYIYSFSEHHDDVDKFEIHDEKQQLKKENVTEHFVHDSFLAKNNMSRNEGSADIYI